MRLSRPLATIGLLLSTIAIVAGCSSKSNGSISANSLQTTNTMESNTKGSAHSTTATYVVPNSLQFPKSMQTYIKKHCRVSIVLPSNLKLDSPIPKNKELAISLDTSTKSYGMDIFERPKGSRTTQFGLADLMGDMGTVTNLSALNIPGSFNTSRFTTHNSVTFSNRMLATYYQNSKAAEYAMIWSIHGWKYIVDVMSGITPKKVYEMSNKISSFVDNHGTIVPNSTKGYVQVLWSGNRPLFRVTWTYGDKQWYSLSMNTLDATLNTVHTMTRN